MLKSIFVLEEKTIEDLKLESESEEIYGFTISDSPAHDDRIYHTVKLLEKASKGYGQSKGKYHSCGFSRSKLSHLNSSLHIFINSTMID